MGTKVKWHIERQIRGYLQSDMTENCDVTFVNFAM